jgi:hypothetical protein
VKAFGEQIGRIPVSIDIEKPLTQAEADSKEVARLVAEGKKVTDPELRRRVRERSEAVQREIFEKHGVVDWAVDMIRDTRDS